MTTYVTKDGDMLDMICHQQLGSVAHVPAVLAANPHLADLGPVYTYGLSIVLPSQSAPVVAGRIKLWGRS